MLEQLSDYSNSINIQEDGHYIKVDKNTAKSDFQCQLKSEVP